MLVTCQIDIRPVRRERKEKTGEGVSFLESSKCDFGSSALCDTFPGDQNLSEVVVERKKRTVNTMKNLHLLSKGRWISLK